MSRRWPFTEVQTAIYTALGSITDLSSVAVPVFDDVPNDQDYPYVVIGDMSADFEDTADDQMVEAVYTVRVWSDYPGSRELLHVLDQVRQALNFRHALTNNFAMCDDGDTVNVSIQDVTEDGADRSVRVASVEHLYRVQDLR